MSKYEYYKDMEDCDVYRVKKGEPGAGNFDTFSPYTGESGEWVKCAKGSKFDPAHAFDKTIELSEQEALDRIKAQVKYRKDNGIPEGKYFSLTGIR